MRPISFFHLLPLVLPPAALTASPALAGGPCPLQLLSESSTTNTVYDIAVQGDVVYCAATAGLDLFDVSSPTNPALLGSWLGGASSVAVDGDLALVGVAGLGTYVVDVSDPTQPTPLANVPVTAPEWARGVEIAGSTGFVGVIAPFKQLVGGSTPTGEVRSYDLSDPSNPVLLDAVAVLAPIRTYLDGTRLFAAGADAFTIIDVSDPSAMTVVGSFAGAPFLFGITGVCASGDLAFVSNLDDPAAVIDISNPASPLPIAQFSSQGGGIHAVGATVYVAGSFLGGGLRVFDVGTPAAPVELGALDTFGFPYCVVSDGDLVYVGEFAAEMTVLDSSLCEGSPFTSFCDDADGALESCPCANAGGPATGCDVPQGTGGVRLAVLAQETGVQNRATLEGSGFPAASTPTSIVIRADTLAPGAVAFGDGLRCIGTPLVRLAPGFATGGVSTHVVGHGAMAGGGSFHYQLWYRSTPATFCTPDAFNLSNGRTIPW